MKPRIVKLENRASRGLRCYTEEFQDQGDSRRKLLEIGVHYAKKHIYAEENIHVGGKYIRGQYYHFSNFLNAVTFIEDYYNIKLMGDKDPIGGYTWQQQIIYAEAHLK